jgi:iron complex transport system substrate-binding protein
LFFLVILSVIFIKGCYGFSPKTTYSPKANLFTAECRTVKHDLGESCIPLNPQRIIVTDQDSLEILVALGFKPIATTRPNRTGNKTDILKDKIDGIIDLGKESSLDIEKVTELDPDLIVGLIINPLHYQLFSQIAPTVSIDFSENNWKKTFLQFANVVDKTQLAEKLLAEYQEKVNKLKLDFAQKLGNIKISVMRFYTTLQFTQFLNKLSFPVSILDELNLSIPLAQLQVSKGANVSYNNVSLERVDLLESDAMFIALDPGAKENFQKYQNSPLWHTLNVVKNNRVYTVDSGYWVFGSILSANAILNDLDKYLLQGS